MKLKTASEMAAMLRCSVKTFNRRVHAHGVPFYDAGQRMFNPDKVLPMLEQIEVGKREKPTAKGRGRGLNLERNKYKTMLGI